ncbi:Meiotic recombination protein dmc1 [Orobanche gracilis]
MLPTLKSEGFNDQLKLVEAEDIDDKDDLFETIEKLTKFGKHKLLIHLNMHVISQGINAEDVKKLQDAGIYTCNGLMMHTKKNLTGKGLSEAKIDKICETVEKIVRKSVICITTESQTLVELLGGWTDKQLPIAEALGEFRPPDQIVPLAERFCMDHGAVLDNMLSAEEFIVTIFYMINQVISAPGGGVFVTDRSKEASRRACARLAHGEEGLMGGTSSNAETRNCI